MIVSETLESSRESAYSVAQKALARAACSPVPRGPFKEPGLTGDSGVFQISSQSLYGFQQAMLPPLTERPLSSLQSQASPHSAGQMSRSTLPALPALSAPSYSASSCI